MKGIEVEGKEMGRHSFCYKQKLKKGLWSPEEDEKLLRHVTNYGHGCWSAVPKQAGLQRCGKSCRLRWINYLRPDLKRGSFNLEEENLIIELHEAFGNRWSTIAAHLPGRTDNEIKNLWNSSIKRKLRERGIDPTTHKPISEVNAAEREKSRTKATLTSCIDQSNDLKHEGMFFISRPEAVKRGALPNFLQDTTFLLNDSRGILQIEFPQVLSSDHNVARINSSILTEASHHIPIDNNTITPSALHSMANAEHFTEDMTSDTPSASICNMDSRHLWNCNPTMADSSSYKSAGACLSSFLYFNSAVCDQELLENSEASLMSKKKKWDHCRMNTRSDMDINENCDSIQLNNAASIFKTTEDIRDISLKAESIKFPELLHPTFLSNTQTRHIVEANPCGHKYNSDVNNEGFNEENCSVSWQM